MNMQNMMRQAQKLQKQMEQKQADLAASQFTGKSAQELVNVFFYFKSLSFFMKISFIFKKIFAKNQQRGIITLKILERR